MASGVAHVSCDPLPRVLWVILYWGLLGPQTPHKVNCLSNCPGLALYWGQGPQTPITGARGPRCIAKVYLCP